MKNTISLKKNREFKTVYGRGKSYANKYLVLFIFKNKVEENKLGISVSKKIGNSVVRNKTKRLIKESYRLLEKDIKIGYDFIVIARQPISNASYKEVFNSVKHLLNKHKLFSC